MLTMDILGDNRFPVCTKSRKLIPFEENFLFTICPKRFTICPSREEIRDNGTIMFCISVMQSEVCAKHTQR